MYKKKIMELLNNDNHFSVPKYVLTYSKQLGLDRNSLILLIYFINKKNYDVFDYKKIMNDLDFSEKDILDAISLLKEKKCLSIEMRKNDSNVLEEIININSFYDIIFSKILDEKNQTVEKQDVYANFEKEFGRTLSPMEYEIISGWLESGTSVDLILAALKESVFNGVSNLRYVDKILYEWNKKGIKSSSDIRTVNKKTEEEKEEDYYEYDWLNEQD